MKMRIERWAVMLLAALLLTVFCSACLAESTATDTVTEIETVSPYRITLNAPSEWNSSNSAVVRVTISETNHLGWYKLEYRMNDGDWTDCENAFDEGEAEIAVHENGTFTLRITDPHGHEFEESTVVSTIDLTAPMVNATINGSILRVSVSDDLSGVAGVQVNSLLFTDVVNDSVTVNLNEVRSETVSIRAFDYAGNFTEAVSLDNPAFAVSASTPKPTEASAAPAATAVPTATSQLNGLGGSLIYVYDEPDPTNEPTQAATPTPIIQTEYITIGPGMPYQADGNSHTLDVLYSAATNKQFITIQTKNGNTFYLVIDYDKPIDEDAEMYETYFLNQVDERDLLALMSDEEKEEVPTPTPEIIYVTPEPTAVPATTAVPNTQEQSGKTDQMTAMIALIAIVALVGIGAFVLMKYKGKGSRNSNDPDLDMDVDEEAE